jgi:hypothetical protein
MAYKSAILFLLFFGIFCACKKTETSGPKGPTQSMSANIGGTQTSFNANINFNSVGMYILGVYTPVNLQYHLQFFGIHPLPGYVGTYKLSSSTGVDYQANYGNGIPPLYDYETNPNDTGVLVVTDYNTEYNTISGSFYFVAGQNYPIPDSGNYIINVTNGFFANLKL